MRQTPSLFKVVLAALFSSSAVPTKAMTSIAAAKLASSSSNTYRVAILGGGVAGCAAARRLAELAPSPSSSPSSVAPRIALYEMGRGPGGRASTRKTRSAPHIHINHGAPYADVRSSTGRSILSSLRSTCLVAPYVGVRGSLDLSTGAFSRDYDVDDSCCNEKEGTSASVDYVTGANGEMSQIASSLIANTPSIEPNYKTMVRHLTRSTSNGEWELRDKSKQIIGVADWLIVAGSSVAHPRWSNIFGGDPPLVEAERDHPDSKLRESLDAIATQEVSPRMAVLFSCSGSVARQWLSLGFNVANVDDQSSSILSKIMIHGGRKGDNDDDEEWCSIVVHSTEEFAIRNSGVYGASSTAARVGGAATDASLENSLVKEMMAALGEVPGIPSTSSDNNSGDCSSSNIYNYGPALHRWGNAFPKGEPLREDLAFVPSSRIAFCGDYVASPERVRFGSFESALLSGTFAGEKISKYYNES